jgi:hypothetical protein
MEFENYNIDSDFYNDYYDDYEDESPINPEDSMDETMKEIYYAYCAVEFNASRIWVDDDYDYLYLSLLQKYYKFVKDVINPGWEEVVRDILDEKTIMQLFNSPPMFFHKFPKFDKLPGPDPVKTILKESTSEESSSEESSSEESSSEFDDELDLIYNDKIFNIIEDEYT